MNAFDQVFKSAVGHEGGHTANSADPGKGTGARRNQGECRGINRRISAVQAARLIFMAGLATWKKSGHCRVRRLCELPLEVLQLGAVS